MQTTQATKTLHKIKKTGRTQGAADHDHDLVHELARRLDSLWRYDQYIENSQGHEALSRFWQDVKAQETQNVAKLKELIAKEIEMHCF